MKVRRSIAEIRSACYIGFISLVVSTLMAACGGGGGGSSAIPAPKPLPSGAPAAIDAIVQQAYPAGFGVELAIYRNSHLVYQHGYGLRDRGLPDQFFGNNFWNIQQPDKQFNMPRGQFAPDIDTAFDLASVSKEFTAGAILLLQQDGKLSVNDPVSKYFPTLPGTGQITLINLLQHSSGFVDYNSFGVYPDFTDAYLQFQSSNDTDYQPIADRLATFPLLFPPGSQFSYSNTNYLLLGMIVAKISGQPLGTFLQQRIFGPLGMTQTDQGYPLPPVTDLALGYAEDSGVVHRAWQWNLAWLAGPGGLTSTVGDLEKWDAAVRSPGIFTQASLTQMFTPGPFPQPYGTYADGWIVAQLSGHKYIWHDGAVGGFSTMNATFPDDGLDIVILTNAGGGLDPYFIIPKIFPIAQSM